MPTALLTLLAALAFGAGPFLVPNFGGFDPDLFPVPQVDPPIQPVGWAFAIWGPIYVWLLASALFGVARRRDAEGWARIRPALIVSLAVGAAWLPIAQQDPLLAAVMIWVMLVSALAVLLRAPRADWAILSWPVGLYAGWLSAAACVALGLNVAGYGFLSAQASALAMLGLATALAVTVQIFLPRVPTYGVAVIWAFAGIYVANASQTGLVSSAALACAAVMAVVTLGVSARGWRRA